MVARKSGAAKKPGGKEPAVTPDAVPPAALPDAAARAAILGDTGVNLVVEAAAGTGKTTCLVGRLMTLFRRGALAGDGRLAAVTFTHKAAAELRERLDRELALALAGRDGLPPEERANLEAAAEALPECHVGTIHSFCARLLRERPVEAGVGPGFRELDEADDRLLRDRAWNEFAWQVRRGGHREIREVFETFGLDQEALRLGFVQFAQYPDVDRWPGADAGVGDIGVDAFVLEVERYLAGLAGLKPVLDEADPGSDGLIPILRILDRRLPRLIRPIGIEDAFRLSGLFKESPRLTLKQWRQFGMDAAAARETAASYARFYDDCVAPFRRDCLAAVYAAALRAFGLARDIYDRLRRAGRLLNFQDLLLAAARLLRDFPGVRADLSDRYRLLLVDEVQDTDPVQAELMFLLAASDAGERDWRRCRPRPGALFIVGDPKQSIYRFRRADIAIYQEIKRLIAESGGRVLGLTANFRSQPAVIDWVNRTFAAAPGAAAAPDDLPEAGKFAASESPHSPAYIPLEPGLAPAGRDCFAGVFRLETIPVRRKEGVGNDAVFRDEAERIARFIRHAVDTGLLLPGPGGPRPAGPGDFLIVPYEKKTIGHYAAALRRLGLACQVAGGAALADSPALELLQGYLEALAWPDDAVRLLAALRGGLFGISDVELYRWKKAGGSFAFLAGRRDMPEAAAPPVAAALATMARHHAELVRREPAGALAAIADDLGLWALASLGDDPATGAGVLAAALDQLRAEAGDIATPGKLAERLAWLRGNREEEPLPARETDGAAVRVMNLHKTKGLEAPVVFLACTRSVQNHPARIAVHRGGEGAAGTLSLSAPGFPNAPSLARPVAWEEMAGEEERFLAAEKIRLNYVAATRAGAALVVSLHQSNKKWQSRFLPPGLALDDVGEPLPEPEPGAIRVDDEDVLAAIDPAGLERCREERESRRPALLAESYRAARAKPDSGLAGGPAPEAAGAALDLGEVLHRLLAMPLEGEALAGTAAELLGEYELPADRAGEVVEMVMGVRGSDLWRRAGLADKCFREAPYAFAAGEGEGAGLEHGVIDLVFREAAGWVVVDYKSDRLAPGADAAAAAARHAGQLAAYARAWRRISGGEVAETGIFFLRSGEYVVIPVGR